MPRAFATWTILPHRPLEKISENFWRVEGTMPDGKTKRNMTLARLKDGRLLVHNAIALEEPLMDEINNFGTVAAIVVPGGFHRLDAKIWKQRFPKALVIAPKGAAKGVGKVVAPEGDFESAPHDDTVRLFYFEGMGQKEGALEVKSKDGTTLVVNDAICNMPKLGGLAGFFMGPTGRPSVPRVTRWLIVKDKHATRSHLEKIAATPGLKRIIFAHGEPIVGDPQSALKNVAAELAP